jgi:ketosteroid isomerase-like protein
VSDLLFVSFSWNGLMLWFVLCFLACISLRNPWAMYAQEVVTFDIVPPLRHIGADALRKLWEEVFSVYQGPSYYEIHDLNITVGDDAAFIHSLNRINGTLNTGQKTDLWLRWTAGFRKINGKWLIVLNHNSVPADLAHGKAVLDLKP